jgi:hypothetical protein
MRPRPTPAVGLVMDPWRFDPAAAGAAANRVILAGSDALTVLRQWVNQAAGFQEATAAVIAARIAIAPIPVYGRPDTFRQDAPPLPHHPFVLSSDVPFLPAGGVETGGALPAPADFIETCFRHGVLRQLPLVPANPILAALALIASETWDALIVTEMKPRASRMVRLQAVRALGRAELLSGFEPSMAEDERFEEWWQTRVEQN